MRDRLDAPGGALSGGQQQRLCIARALAVQPNVLLMDEPCSALDPTSTRRIEETIAELQRAVTIVIVTHNMQQAQRVSHWCAFFLAAEDEPGRVIEQGPTEKIFSDPDDDRTLVLRRRAGSDEARGVAWRSLLACAASLVVAVVLAGRVLGRAAPRRGAAARPADPRVGLDLRRRWR